MLDRIVDEAEAGQLPVLIEELEGSWLARALRIDLALLVARPELTVPSLLRRCVWFGEEYPSFARTVVPPGADEVRAMVRSWRWKPHLRSLRSPIVPLDGGVIEEYRTDEEGAPWVTASHVGAGNVAWERASGRRVTVAPPVTTPPRWQLDRSLFQLVSSDRAWPLPFAPDDHVTLVEVVDHLAFLTTSFWDYDDHICRTHAFDLRTGEIAFECDHDTSAAARFGDRLYLDDDGHLRILTLDGEHLADHTIHGWGLTFAPDGSFATRTGSVIRVWAAGELARFKIPDVYERGLVAISRDSSRVITGQAVCDAHTGEELFRVEFQGLGNWLEGGPPRNCRALCDDVIVEILPFGYRLWDSTTGEILVDNRDHDANTRDVVAFAPDGRRHAILHGDVVRVFDNHSLAVLHESRISAENTWRATLEFSADSATLWWAEGGPATAIQLSGTSRREPVAVRSGQIADGVVTLDGLALPIDDAQAIVSADGKVVLGWGTHYVRG